MDPPLDEAHQQALASSFTLREVDAAEHLVLPGSTDHEVLFVSDGLLRFYDPADDGRESNRAFEA